MVNIYPWGTDSDTEVIAALTLPVVLWFVIAYPYMGGTIRSLERRMDFVRFTGEWFIYYVLIALGGGVLMGLTADPRARGGRRRAGGGVGAALGSRGCRRRGCVARRVEQRVVENMAPVLTMLFTPLFAVMLACAAVVYAVTGLGARSIGAPQRPRRPPGGRPRARAVRDVRSRAHRRRPDGWTGFSWSPSSALWCWTTDGARRDDRADRRPRIPPNRTAALGLNLVLLVNLAGAAWLSARFLTGRTRFQRLERWQTTYLPVFALWAAAVVVFLPPLFGFD